MTKRAYQKIIIVGGVAAGMSAASKAKRENPQLKVTVYEKSHYISYGACGMPYVISGEIPELGDLVARTPQEMAKKGVDVYVRHEVTAVRPDAKTVTVTNLETGETLTDSYDALVLATGASAVRPDLPGIDLEGVYVLRTMEDAGAIDKAAPKAQNAAIIGGSYIGLEMAEALSKAGCAVTVIELQEKLLATFGDAASRGALEELGAHGVEVKLGAHVTGLEGSGRVERVRVGNLSVAADLVLVAVGARPNNALAKALGLELGPSGAILTDAQLNTALPDIYAAGDVTAVEHRVTGKPAWLPLGDTANKQGRILGTVLAGKEARFKGVTGTAIVKVFDRAFATTGLTLEAAQAAGFAAQSKTISDTDHAGYYPDKRPLSVTLVWDTATTQLLGAQFVGYGDAVKRVDVVAALLAKGGTLQDLADLDLAYAPPFSGVWDALLVAANVALG